LSHIPNLGAMRFQNGYGRHRLPYMRLRYHTGFLCASTFFAFFFFSKCGIFKKGDVAIYPLHFAKPIISACDIQNTCRSPRLCPPETLCTVDERPPPFSMPPPLKVYGAPHLWAGLNETLTESVPVSGKRTYSFTSHLKQRAHSFLAVSSSKPSSTSLKLLTRSSGSSFETSALACFTTSSGTFMVTSILSMRSV
jgi:hypothetical protein